MRKEFDSLRDCGKTITLNAIYSKPKKNSSSKIAISGFRNMYPFVMDILDVFKHDNHAVLPVIMQRIESKCILDHCSKKIALQLSEALILTKHDSVITTKKHADVVEQVFQDSLNSYFKTSVRIERSEW